MKKIIWITILIVGVALVLAFGFKKGGENLPEASTFTHAEPGFSFEYLPDFNVTSFADEAGETILVQDSTGSGLQIYLSIFDDTDRSNTTNKTYSSNTTYSSYSLTAEKIKREIPDMILNNPRNFDWGGARAVAFEGQDESQRETYEVWVVYGGYLYQVLSYADQKDLVDQILKSWKWQ